MSDAKTDAKAIFLEALDCQGAEELRGFLDRACGSDPALRRASRSCCGLIKMRALSWAGLRSET